MSLPHEEPAATEPRHLPPVAPPSPNEPSPNGPSPVGLSPNEPSPNGPSSQETAGGDAPVQLLAPLRDLPALPLSEHAEVYQRLHGQLQDALAGIDSQ